MKKSGMIDNRKVKDNHQEGIKRVLQRPGDMKKGQSGKMSDKGKANFKRPNNTRSPVGA